VRVNNALFADGSVFAYENKRINEDPFPIEAPSQCTRRKVETLSAIWPVGYECIPAHPRASEVLVEISSRRAKVKIGFAYFQLCVTLSHAEVPER